MNALRSWSVRADIETMLAEYGAEQLDIPVLQPADPFLDIAGEELRRRIFLSESETGEALCLRPEFTIPVCMTHIGEGREAPHRYGYVGMVFRQRRAGSNEFLQAGIEDIGDPDEHGADARSLSDALAFLDRLGAPKTVATLGDQSIFNALVSELGLPKNWAVRLLHAFGDHQTLDVALQALASPAPLPDVPDDIRQPAAEGDRAALEAAVAVHLREAGLENSGGRDAAEIAERLLARFDEVRATPDETVLARLRAFLAIRVPLRDAVEELNAFARLSGLSLDGAVTRFAAREAKLREAGVDTKAVIYDAAFGRPLDYYTAMVFEIAASDGAVLAGGGRYDRLLTMLGATRPVPGVGFSVWLDRVAARREMAQ